VVREKGDGGFFFLGGGGMWLLFRSKNQREKRPEIGGGRGTELTWWGVSGGKHRDIITLSTEAFYLWGGKKGIDYDASRAQKREGML